MKREILINADDFGWTNGHNLAVERGFKHGVLNRASLMSNGNAFDQAVALSLSLPGLQVGVHLTLNEGRPILSADNLPNLTRADGTFSDSLISLFMLWIRGYLNPSEVRREWAAQVEHALSAGIRITHLDSHKHAHLLPPLLETTIRLAKEYDVAYVRLPLEKDFVEVFRRCAGSILLWLLAYAAQSHLKTAGLKFAGNFAGVGTSGRMTRDRLVKLIQSAPEGVSEIMVHPAVVTPEVQALRQRYAWAAKYHFEEELEAICDRASLQVARPLSHS